MGEDVINFWADHKKNLLRKKTSLNTFGEQNENILIANRLQQRAEDGPSAKVFYFLLHLPAF